MKNLHRIFCWLIFCAAVLFVNAGCGTAKGKNQEAVENTAPAEVKTSENTAPQNKSVKKVQIVSAASIAGTYKYDTYNNGEGFDNEMEITNAGGGKLKVYLSGSSVYKNGETQSVHEAEGSGEGVLRGNTANVTLVDERDKSCAATIVFAKSEATVKISDACQFNIQLGGVYKKAKSANKNQLSPAPAAPTPTVSAAELLDFVNDFDQHRPGDKYIVSGVAAGKIENVSRADEFGNASYKNLFYLEDPEGKEASGSFLTSAELIENLPASGENEAQELRVSAILIESNGKFDVYRLSFVTKIEGLNSDGSVMWTANGNQPPRINFTH